MKPKTNAHKSHKKQSGHNNNPQSGKSAAKSDLAIVKQPKRRPSDSKNDEEDIDNPNSGFAEYLKSGTAMEMMRMFVLANSLVLFVTVAWPSMKQSYQVVMEMLYGEEEEKAEL